jgi:hypothetical protein
MLLERQQFLSHIKLGGNGIGDKGFEVIILAIARATLACKNGTTQPFFLDFRNNIISDRAM